MPNYGHWISQSTGIFPCFHTGFIFCPLRQRSNILAWNILQYSLNLDLDWSIVLFCSLFLLLNFLHDLTSTCECCLTLLVFVLLSPPTGTHGSKLFSTSCRDVLNVLNRCCDADTSIRWFIAHTETERLKSSLHLRNLNFRWILPDLLFCLFTQMFDIL